MHALRLCSPTIQVLRSADVTRSCDQGYLQLKMELSESVMKGLQNVADPNVFDLKSFTIFTELVFDSLVSPRRESVLGKMVEVFLCAALLPVLSTQEGSRAALSFSGVIF